MIGASEARRGLAAAFFLILALMVLFQVWRLGQAEAASWLAVDYAMRVTVLVLLGVLGNTRGVAFGMTPLRIGQGELSLWLLGGVLIALGFPTVEHFLSGLLPDMRFGFYPRPPHLSAKVIDLTFGIGLTALHEEVFFRRVARAVFHRLGNGLLMVIATSTVFGLFHWWTGPANMLLAGVVGAFLMLLYQRAGALWPAVAVHYLIDFWTFA